VPPVKGGATPATAKAKTPNWSLALLAKRGRGASGASGKQIPRRPQGGLCRDDGGQAGRRYTGNSKGKDAKVEFGAPGQSGDEVPEVREESRSLVDRTTASVGMIIVRHGTARVRAENPHRAHEREGCGGDGNAAALHTPFAYDARLAATCIAAQQGQF